MKRIHLTILATFLAACSSLDQIARDAPPESTAAWLVSAGEPILALEHLQQHAFASADAYGEVGDVLRAEGHSELAFEAYECALQRELWEYEWMEAMSELDAERAFASLHSLLEEMPREEWELLGDLHDGIPIGLHGLGRDEEAARFIGEPSEHVHEPAGCVGWTVYGDAWELEIWKRTRAAEVETLLLPILQSNYGMRSFAWKHLSELARSKGDADRARTLLALYRSGGNYDAVRFARAASEFGDNSGWQELERRVGSEPDDAELGLPLADFMESEGREAEARDLRFALMMEQELPDDVCRALFREAPTEYRALLDARTAKLIGDLAAPEADEDPYDLAELLTLLGFRAEALELYRRAAEIDPMDSSLWESIQLLELEGLGQTSD